MNRRMRREIEVKRLLGVGRPVSATRDSVDQQGRAIAVTASLQRVGDRYYLRVEQYYPTGAFGQTIMEKESILNDTDEALRQLVELSGIPLHAFQ